MWAKVLILVGFDDIRCDIGVLGLKWVKCLILLGLMGFLFSGFKMKLV